MLELIDKQETLKKLCETCGYCEKFEKAVRTRHPDFVTDRCNFYKFLAARPAIKAEPEYAARISKNLPTKSNADRIRQMTDEELVMALDTDCDRCARSENCELCGDPVSYGICVKGNIEWLKQEVSEDANNG